MSDLSRELKVNTSVVITATIEFSEGELRALDAMVGYGIDPFLKVFYAQLGKSYMQPYEKNLRILFSRINNTVPEALKGIDSARKILSEYKEVQK